MQRFIWVFLFMGICLPQFAGTAEYEAAYDLLDDGSIGSWLFLGPLSNPSGEVFAGHDFDFLEGESQAVPKKDQEIQIVNDSYQWKLRISGNSLQRLHERFPSSTNETGYFFCQLEVAREAEYRFHIISDDTIKLWLDGNLIHSKKQARNLGHDPDLVKATLSQGRHRLLAKVDHTFGSWGLGVKILNQENQVSEDIKIIIPGDFDKEEYLDLLLQVQALPLVSKDGSRHFRLAFSRMIRPSDIESITITDTKKSNTPLAKIDSIDSRTMTVTVPRSEEERDLILSIQTEDQLLEKTIHVNPCRNWRVYLMPGSHVDIGYTNLQPIVLDDHVKFIKQAIDLYEESLEKGYIPEARYVWNTEVTWALKHFLRTEPPTECEQLLSYIRQGVVSLDAFYLNMLTALCGDEELIRNVYYSAHLAQEEHLSPPVQAMITDVPGYTWGTIYTMANAGVKYFQLGPNYSARIGYATIALNGKPYYWIAPDGNSQVLVWNTGYGYAMIFNLLQNENDKDKLLNALLEFENDEDYPYDIAQFRAYFADNTPPPAHLSEVVHEWNQQYDVPKLIISDAKAPFEDLVSKYKNQIPTYQGDYTPYWEDGAASSARETSMNRTATLQLQNAEKAWAFAAMAGSDHKHPARKIETAYDHALLYDEHTWGAHNSISQPESEFAKEQWRIKRSYVEKARWMASNLEREGIVELTRQIPNGETYSYAVWNLTQWERTDIASLPLTQVGNALSSARQWVAVDKEGNRSPVYREEKGYSFLAQNVPPFGYKVYQFVPESIEVPKSRIVLDAPSGSIHNPVWEIKVEKETGAMKTLQHRPTNRQFADSESEYGINQYLHVLGPNGRESKGADQVYISAGEESNGLSTELAIQLEAQGVESLQQKVILYEHLNRVDLINIMNKSDIREKEAVRFAFPFKVPEGKFTLEIPLASMHPEEEQIPGANRNIYTIRRWIDVSTKDYGITLVSHDAPLIELCDMHAEQAWLEHLPLINLHLYSYVMNNYWFTNYKASQGGPAVFRYSLAYHDGPCKPSHATRFADEVSYPLQVVPLPLNSKNKELLTDDQYSFVTIDAPNVLLQNIKRAEDGNGWIVRLRELDGIDSMVKIKFNLFDAIQWEKTDIVERPVKGENGRSNESEINLSIGSKEIKTYRVLGKCE